ncbi:MAG: DUF3576 domain-containing protein [Rhodospirillales bacterium CG15_BIG_FIL_POST_REV_8_21_14_020_66_15]|nr:MAG: DUF3576 domain-containing protein [Rhodospirillales bacterium CG15_BIG_FIL_POST_REV_8_21_14_020_66_15]
MLAAAAAAGLVLGTAACSDFSGADIEATTHDQTDTGDKRETILGSGGISLFGEGESGGGGGALGVNSFLWRATLDTIAFMPVSTADPFGGVILTDWHSTEEAPNERFKLNVYILGRTLRADGIRVAVFSQTKDAGGQWRDAAVPEQTGTKIEDAILTRARQLRRQTINSK